MTIVKEYIIYVSNKISSIIKQTNEESIKIDHNGNVDEFLDEFLKKELFEKCWYVKWENNNIIDFTPLCILLSHVSNDELIDILNIKISCNLKIFRFCKSQLKKTKIQIILFVIIILLHYYICYKIETYLKFYFTIK